MIIDKAEVIVTSPDRNFVTLKLTTDDGLTGLGDATLNGRELAVVAYLTEHVVPLLIGADASPIEDTWQFLYRSAYWRRGPVTMAAIASVDMALWDIKGKAAGMPVYQLLGGASRNGLMAYGHASGKELPELFDSIRAHQEQGYKAIRVQTGVPTLKAIYGIAAQGADVGDATVRYDHEPARRGAKPVEEDWDTRAYLNHLPGVFEAVRNEFGPDIPLLHDGHHRMTPIQAARLGKDLEPYDLFWLEDCTPAENQEALRLVRQHTTTPLAIGEIFNTIWDFKDIIRDQLIDYVRGAVTHMGGITSLEEDARLRRDVPDQVRHARADRHLAGRHGRRDAPRPLDPQLRHPGVHEARREDRPGLRAVLHLDRRLPPPRRQPGTRCRTERRRGRQVPVRAGLPALQPPARRHRPRLVSAVPGIRRIVVMGVSGCGKSTVAAALAARAGLRFLDGDSLHSPSNVAKMAAGTPLVDADRWPWLDAVGAALADAAEPGLVVACSALKRAYRDRLRAAAPGTLFAHLDGDADLLAQRLRARIEHFMPVAMLTSQLATLERLAPDECGVVIDIGQDVADIVDATFEAIKAMPACA